MKSTAGSYTDLRTSFCGVFKPQNETKNIDHCDCSDCLKVIVKTLMPNQKETMQVAINAIADIPIGMEKEVLIDLLLTMHWYGEKLFKAENISAKAII